MMSDTRPTRRDVLAGFAGAAATAGLGAGAALAKAPFATRAPAAYHHLAHGEFQVSVVSDRPLLIGDARNVLKEITPEEVARRLESSFLSAERTAMQQNIVVVNTGAKLAVIDTGMGAHKMFGDTTGKLPANLAAAGIDPAAVDAVILSHCHPDHAGGLVDAAGKPVFPNAEVLVNEADLAFWTDEAKLSGDLKGMIAVARGSLIPLKDRIRPLKHGQEAIGGITALDAPGHTVGHMIFMVASGGKTMAVTADCLHHHVLMVEAPRTEFAFDTDAKQAVATRLKLLDMLAADRIPFMAYHFPWPGLGHIARTSETYRYVAEPIYL